MSPGLLVIISSPSGGGKDAVINALLKIFKNSVRLVTTTSRPPRPGNVEGVDYHFISPEEFKRRIKEKEFVEYNVYSGNYYGTEKTRLAEAQANHPLVLTQIEVNGKHNYDKAKIPHLSIFLLPENSEQLANRIKKRGGLNEAQINERLEIAKKEIKASVDYDYKIVNAEGKLNQTIDKIAKIIEPLLKSPMGVDKKLKIS